MENVVLTWLDMWRLRKEQRRQCESQPNKLPRYQCLIYSWSRSCPCPQSYEIILFLCRIFKVWISNCPRSRCFKQINLHFWYNFWYYSFQSCQNESDSNERLQLLKLTNLGYLVFRLHDLSGQTINRQYRFKSWLTFSAQNSGQTFSTGCS